jgi:2-C-methyl-D-erythritol 4-phosphate cytidylyltransferase/2-C-methyl-D-erythritol 2,4-cyclodiphosphate synthase
MGGPTPARFAAVIVAAGQGLRAGRPVPKQFARWRGKPLVRHSTEALLATGAGPVIVAIPEGAEAIAADALAGLEMTLVTGGATRQASVLAALEALPANAERVLIHDAARPNCPAAVVERLVAALDTHPGAIPVLPVVDSIALADGDLMGGSASRGGPRGGATPPPVRRGPQQPPPNTKEIKTKKPPHQNPQSKKTPKQN